MIEGKLANRNDTTPWNNKHGDKTKCRKCSRLFNAPENIVIHSGGKSFYCKSYAGTPYFIYESKAGSVNYCSKQCAHKHNHRFRK